MPTTVVNIRDHPDWEAEGGVYIGRGKGSMFANPFKIGVDGDRDNVISLYRIWFDQHLREKAYFRDAVEELRGKMLVCWCAPLACHGSVIVEYLEGNDG